MTKIIWSPQGGGDMRGFFCQSGDFSFRPVCFHPHPLIGRNLFRILFRGLGFDRSLRLFGMLLQK